MKKFRPALLHFFFFLFSLILPAGAFCNGACPTLPKPSNDFIVLTLPKSGSHLMAKLILMLSSNNQISLHEEPQLSEDRLRFYPYQNITPKKFLSQYSSPARSFYAHFNFSEVLKYFTQKHPRYVKIIMIRDLRDVCVSTAYFIDAIMETHFGPNLSFDEKLLAIIESKGFLKGNVFNVKKQAKNALPWFHDPEVIVCRFEDFCGENGGGSRALQEANILHLANALNISLSQEELTYLADNLWGGTLTFRKGQKDSWKTHFKSYHKKAFKKRLGALLIELGYEKDNNW